MGMSNLIISRTAYTIILLLYATDQNIIKQIWAIWVLTHVKIFRKRTNTDKNKIKQIYIC